MVIIRQYHAQSSSAGSPVLTGVLIVQPAPTQHTFNAKYQDNVLIPNSIVMVILNVNMEKMRILMCARKNTKKTMLYQNMPPLDARALCNVPGNGEYVGGAPDHPVRPVKKRVLVIKLDF